MRVAVLVLVLALVLMPVACTPVPGEAVTVSIELAHGANQPVSRTMEMGEWQVGEIKADPVFTVYNLTIGDRELVCDDQGAIFDLFAGTTLIVTQQFRLLLDELIQELNATTYGKPMRWGEASIHLPRMGEALLLDLETGKSFTVQRRGGSEHADVQPLTREDTAIMKAIYGGEWSWDRRAVVVITGQERIAGSINGMPHGQGSLSNNFTGHFCLHFLGCSTHGSSTVDLGHQLMVHKAAGTLWALARSAKPEEQIKNYAASLNQKDFWLASVFTYPKDGVAVERLLEPVRTIEIKQVFLDGPTTNTANLRCIGEIIFNNGGRKKFECEATLVQRNGVWSVNPSFLDRIIGS